jgi:hypothetical protein
MGRKNRWLLRCLAGLVLSVSALSGCQTYMGGMTLPSPHYLKHYPQYFPPDPPYPLQRERDSMLDPEGTIRKGNPVPAIPGAPPAGGVNPAPAGPGR